jgi:peptidoglycan/LPS O-acetylase OafA/YrhL
LGLILAKISGKVWSHSKLKFFTIAVGTSIILFGHLFLPPALHELLRGYGALLVALSISSPALSNPVVRQIGNCAFGIYLIHLLFVEFFQTLIKRIYPDFTHQASTEALLLLALLIFLLSWITALGLRQQSALSHLKLL